MGRKREFDETKSHIDALHEKQKGYEKDLRSYQEEKSKIQKNKDQLKDNGSSEQITEQTECLKEADEKIDQCRSRLNGIETDLMAADKKIAVICAQARNEFSTEQIKKDFKAGLKVIKRQADDKADEDSGDEEEEEDKDDGSAHTLQVFCCSANEYQKMQNPSLEDGSSKVFGNIADTQIPRLRNYVHEVTSRRKQQGMEALISELRRFVSDFQNETADATLQHDLMDICNEYVGKSEKELISIVQTLSKSIEKCFGDIYEKLTEGAKTAEQQAENTCENWGKPTTPVKTTSRNPNGYPYKTYTATVYRSGEFRSPKYGYINFNQDLAKPMTEQQTCVWDQVFNKDMNDILDTTKRRACSTMNTIAGEICDRLRKLALLDADKEDFMYIFINRLPDMLVGLESHIDEKQKTLSRHIVPFIQKRLHDTYVECSNYNGSGMFLRIKQKVCADIRSLKSSMFGDGIKDIMEELNTLKVEIVERVTGVFYSLIEDLKTGFKSLIDSTPDYRSLQNILKKCAKVLRESSSNQDSQQENDSQNSSGGWTHDLEVGTSQTSQSAEFGDSFKRKLDFDERFRDMKRQKSECYSPDDLDLVLIESKADYEKQHGFKSRLKKNCHANGLEFRGVTPANGDCFFEAISSQLQRIESRYIDPKELRLSVAEYIRENPTYMFQGKDGIVSLKDYMGESLEEYCEKMSKKTTWADHIVVMAMARMLKYDIVIVTSSPSTSGDNCLIWVKGDEDDGKKLLLLGHLWEYHYQSLQPTSA